MCIRQTSGVQKGKFEETAIIFALPERQEFNDCSGTGAPVTQSFQGVLAPGEDAWWVPAWPDA
jgi:hypothetical protein